MEHFAFLTKEKSLGSTVKTAIELLELLESAKSGAIPVDKALIKTLNLVAEHPVTSDATLRTSSDKLNEIISNVDKLINQIIQEKDRLNDTRRELSMARSKLQSELRKREFKAKEQEAYTSIVRAYERGQLQWNSSKGYILIRNMNDDHLFNTLAYVRDEANTKVANRKAWIKVFSLEIAKRS